MSLPTPLTDSELAAIEARNSERRIESQAARDETLTRYEFNYDTGAFTDIPREKWEPDADQDIDRLTEALRSQREQLTAIEQILDAALTPKVEQNPPGRSWAGWWTATVGAERLSGGAHGDCHFDSRSEAEAVASKWLDSNKALTLVERVQRVAGRKVKR